MEALCLDCSTLWQTGEADKHTTACPSCGSRRLKTHAELSRLSVAHIDCDAFYAAVEKRDNPDIRGKPVIVGGGKRGVVSAACYIARIKGVRSAMPMFKALKACPEAVVIRPDIKKYRTVGREVRDLMESLTPLVEPLSIDEAFLDLSGTRALHGVSPAESLVRLTRRIEDEIGVTASIGLSYNKFLAKIASDLDKPRGFAAIGEGDALRFLEDKPVGLIYGVGKSLRASLEKDGITTIGDLRRYSETDLMKRYGAVGKRLHHFSHGRDKRRVDPGSEAKNISAETTFEEDLSSVEDLSRELWPLCETLSGRLKKAGLGCATATLKVRTADFRIVTRNRQLTVPTQLAEDLFTTGKAMLSDVADGRKFRLIGIGAAKLVPGSDADYADLADPDKGRRVRMETAMDALREKFGSAAVGKGRGFKP